jgi:lysozyme
VTELRTGARGLDLIKSFEGLRLSAYRDSVGIWTIGYGHTKGVKPGDTITVEQANDFLREDLRDAERAVNDLTFLNLTQSQFDALVSFTFNLGRGNLQASTLLRRVNEGDFEGAAEEFLRWTKAGGKVLPGLVRRREAERALFLKGDA